MLSESVRDAGEIDSQEFDVVSITLSHDSYLTGLCLRDTDMRLYHCMVISVLRGEEFITNPGPQYRFEEGDVVWVAGDISACPWMEDEIGRGGIEKS